MNALEQFSLKDRVAVVLGGTSGIGLAIARNYAQDGAHVVINGFGDKDAIEKERSGIEKDFGIKCLYSGADMSKPTEIAAMSTRATSIAPSAARMPCPAGAMSASEGTCTSS